MKMATAPLVPCGKSQGAGADSRASTTPSVMCMVGAEKPMPNIETLKTILRLYGCPEQIIDVIADGFAPREFCLSLTRFWMVRDAFYHLAAHSVHCFMGNALIRLPLQKIVSMILETMSPQDTFIHELSSAANSVRWMSYSCGAGFFTWPSFIPFCTMEKDLWTAIRLYVLYTIWCMNPALLPIDFSSGLSFFTDTELANIQSLADIIATLPPPKPPIPSKPQEPSATAPILDAELKRLLDVLKNGPKSATELKLALRVKRGILRKRYLVPGEKKGLIEKTAPGSSSKQRYRLVPAACQVSTMTVTGTAEPVMVELKDKGKQVEPPENNVSGIIAVSRAHDAPAIRLARYCRRIDVEKALIKTFRVERFLRSSFVSATEQWKELGIVCKLSATDLFSFRDCLFNPKYWGAHGGLLLASMQRDSSGNYCSFTIGESTLISIFAQTAGLDLAACSKTERAEMAKMEGILSPAELYLTNYYAQHFGISSDIDKPYHGEKNAMRIEAIGPFDLYRPGVSKIIFHGKARAPQMQLVRLDFFGGTLLLPITYYASPKDPSIYSVMPEVQDTPVLYNSDLIAANPEAEVILTDEIGIPLVNDSDGDYIFSSWYGGMEIIDKLDFNLLQGHPLRWLCFNSGEGPVKMYEKAVKVGNMIFQHHGRKIACQVFDRATWTRNEFGMETGIYESSRDMSFDELMAEAAKYGVGGCGSAEVADLHVYTMDELLKLKPEEFILTPVLMPGFYCLIYGGSGVAKTWFALHLAICLSQGQAPFKHWDFCGTAPLNVLYVAGEMRPSVYGKRLGQLLAKQKANPHFGLIREDLDFTTEVDQETITKAVKELKSKVVVLDNLSTLATNGHTEGQFEKILGFIRKLQADGIIVLLVHHENREGGFKGSGKIELVADQSLHLFSAGKGDKIELLVRAEKIRMTSKAEQEAFHTEFDPKDPTTVWETRPLKPEECRRLDIDDPLGEVERNVGKKRKNNQLAWKYLNDDERAIAILDDMLNGCLDDVIAADLAVRESVISDFKQQYGISPEALDLHLAEAKEIAKNNSGKITPNELAPILWKRLTDNKK